MKFLILFAAAIACSQAVSSLNFLTSKEWIAFKAKFKKNYNNNVTEEKFRGKMYLENKKMIADHNAKYKKGLVSDEFALNEFADMSSDEFSSFYAGLKLLKLRQPRHTNVNKLLQYFVIPNGFRAPTTVDWRKKGAVTNVKHQGQCGSCWAFSAFQAHQGSTVIGYKRIRSGDEMSLQAAVARIGPISVLIDSRNMQFYSKGVHRHRPGTQIELDHAVLVVGYGKEKKGKEYWLVKNSWGSEWGEKGYFKIARNENNQCGIASDASYPVIQFSQLYR